MKKNLPLSFRQRAPPVDEPRSINHKQSASLCVGCPLQASEGTKESHWIRGEPTPLGCRANTRRHKGARCLKSRAANTANFVQRPCFASTSHWDLCIPPQNRCNHTIRRPESKSKGVIERQVAKTFLFFFLGKTFKRFLIRLRNMDCISSFHFSFFFFLSAHIWPGPACNPEASLLPYP